MPAPDSPQVSHFVQASQYRRGAGRRFLWIVLHSTENTPGLGVAEAVARDFATTSRPASAHYVVGGDDVIQCVSESDIAWAAPGANRNGIHVEHVGRADVESWADWIASNVPQRSAPLVRCVALRTGVPVRFVDAERLLLLEPGITTHWEVTQAVRLAHERGLSRSMFFTGEQGHHDPGRGFDVDAFIEMVKGDAQA